ncbi:serine protease nudel isoform X2 [Aethina tumida]|uniref:serine protease nudel isoform X2 n=1 Tax=Aethina tumida TaxID=116153 RepID=UPI0021472F07|nr:serine protease nudel isoform X2 [Aethina tumida]
METFCGSSVVNPSKFRPSLSNNFFHNVPSCPPRNYRQNGSEYALPNSTRRPTPSLTNAHTSAGAVYWQSHNPRSVRSCISIGNDYNKASKGKICTIALAIASFLVLIAVLAIAGMALYMGTLHPAESTSGLITFSCSAKVLRGDRFVGSLQEKAARYKRQLEALYQRSTLGPALVSCTLDSFGNDTLTFYFKVILNKRKLTKSPSSVEKNIKDILLSDAISRKPVFRNIRFDPRSVYVRQTLETEKLHTSPVLKPKENFKTIKSGVVLKTHNYNISHLPVPPTRKLPVKEDTSIKEAEDTDDVGDLPVIQGSFKISKTEADITEKKSETTTAKPYTKISQSPTKKTTFKESSVTSALYKIAAVEKVTKTPTTTPKIIPTSSLTTKTITTPSTTVMSTTSTTPSATKEPSVTKLTPTEDNKFIINPHMFDDEPWIPILSGPTVTVQSEITLPPLPSTIADRSSMMQRPFYTSFTNPGLSFHFADKETLGSSSLKSHPIPVNKLPQLTEPSLYFQTNTENIEKIPSSNFHEVTEKQSDFIEVETVKYMPETEELKKEQMLKNLSSIFHTLASSLDSDNVNLSNVYENTEKPQENFSNNPDNEGSFGQGQVEVVVETDVDDLMLQTTKLPLVTLLPAKSNSGVGRPLRRRPYKPGEVNNLSIENRSFPDHFVKIQSDEEEMKKVDNLKLEDFKIIGVLNFATDSTLEGDDKHQDIVRYPKMDVNIDNNTEISVFAVNSTVSSSRSENKTNFNKLTPEKLKHLAEISKVHDNNTVFETEPLISNKAISSSYTINHSGFKVLTKTLNKINGFKKEDVTNSYSKVGFKIQNDKSECGNFTIRCGDGKCLPETTKCNQLIDCVDGKDEEDCNCADYLRSQYLIRKICDGVVDCWDYSDENQCEWCLPNQYVCSNSKVCIDKTKICDGFRDCPQGDDERQCVTIAANVKAADEFPYYSEGYLMVRKYGVWGKLCIDNFENVVSKSHISWEISDLGKSVCKSMTYQNLETIKAHIGTNDSESSPYYELSYSFQNETKSSLSFKETSCKNRKTVKVKCQTLECGARPQIMKHIARVVGGGNAGLGAWPWQAALYKEGEFQCGATLLSDKWLVSAGHCFYHSQDEHWVARLGALRRGTTLPSPYEQLRAIVKIIVHPGYVDSGFINDISLLQMEFPVVYSDYVRPICLPAPNEAPMDGRLCTIVGWGQLFEVGRIFPDTLQEVQVPIISTAECRKRTVFLPLYKITEDMFCAGYERGGRDACLGDSGGPLMCPEPNGRWILQGITSNGYGCARANRPGVYTKVANYVNWINSHLVQDYKSENVTGNKSKNVCAGHRCPLGECLPDSHLCNGYIECSDGSDEKNC